jgi:hypothetical protein
LNVYGEVSWKLFPFQAIKHTDHSHIEPLFITDFASHVFKNAKSPKFKNWEGVSLRKRSFGWIAPIYKQAKVLSIPKLAILLLYVSETTSGLPPIG